MSFKKPDTNYWNNKFTAYMHDSIDKVFDIKGHEERAKRFLSQFGLDFPNNEFWRIADGIASGFERGQLPSYSDDKDKNGAVDFIKFPYISHPTSSENGLNIRLPHDLNIKKIEDEILNFITKEIGVKAGEGGYSDKFKGDEEKFAFARFLYTHLVLRFRLADKNIANLGALWHRIPADSRFPDHSIWQHNQLTSAIYSCMELSRGDTEARKNNIGLMVFSITPVQGFISKARKLRDFWSGSVLLSYLSYEGIVWVIENLGPDHIIYPSLIDQPLIAEYMKNNYGLDEKFFPELWKKHDKTIANFTNKFLFLLPFDSAEEIGYSIRNHIKDVWMRITGEVYGYLIRRPGLIKDDQESQFLSKMFERQTKEFWELQWSAVRLAGKEDYNEIKKLMAPNSYENQYSVLNIFNAIIANKKRYEKSGKGVLYSVSHSLVQSALAAAKTKKSILRDEEPGEKCQMCGEFEVLHTKEYKNNQKAKEYKENIKSFWEELAKDEYNFNKNERLCSICLTKRLLAIAIGRNFDFPILKSVFKNYETFPTTTYLSLYNYYKRKGIKDENEKREIAQKLFDNKLDTIENIENRDKYYAILIMDGDKMGDLINGKTIASTWKSVMHPEIVERLENNPYFDGVYREGWKKIFNEYPKRLLTPSIHASISEALGDFAIYGVSSIIKKYDGRLIYAGADDVCAVMPIDTVFDAACEIQQYYVSSFRFIHLDGTSEEIKKEFKPKIGKLSINLGKGDGISISAGILICHHKDNLSDMIRRAYSLLEDVAKDKAGRNAFAIELKKRNGGSRYFIDKWSNKEAQQAFKDFGNYVRDIKDKSFSTSLIYRLQEFRIGIETIMNSQKNLKKFIATQIKRSGVGNKRDKEIEEIANTVIKLCVKEGRFDIEPLIISSFIAGGKIYD